MTQNTESPETPGGFKLSLLLDQDVRVMVESPRTQRGFKSLGTRTVLAWSHGWWSGRQQPA
jgi:hypothetical protein